MNGFSIVYRRGDVVLVTSESEAVDKWWHPNEEMTVLTRDVDDATLGRAIAEALAFSDAHAGRYPSRVTPEESARLDSLRCAATGARNARDFAKGNDAVSFDLDDEGLQVCGLVSDRHGGFGSWGGEVNVAWPQSPSELAQLCRQAWERGGVPEPEGAEPSHT